MWNFQINNNGNSADDIKERFIAVSECARKLEKALLGLNEVFNGRNYQTLMDGQDLRDADLEVFRGMLTSVKQMDEMSISGAVKAIRHREGL